MAEYASALNFSGASQLYLSEQPDYEEVICDQLSVISKTKNENEVARSGKDLVCFAFGGASADQKPL